MEGVIPYSQEQCREFGRLWLNTTVAQAFHRTCDTHPEKDALIEAEKRLTFSQVREHVHTAAAMFQRLGLGKESPVLFQVPNWVEAVYAYLGLASIGSIPVLLLPRMGERELAHFCTLTEAVAWIGPARYEKMAYMPILGRLRERCPHLKHIIVVRDEAPDGAVSFSELMEETSSTNGRERNLPGPSPSPEDVLHLAPTGGTTGLSKLAPKTHNVHLSKSYYFTRHLERGYGEVVLAVNPLTHDAPHLFSLCSWILFGGKLVLCPSTKPRHLLETIQKERVTYFFTVPTLLMDILQEPDLDAYDLSSLDAVMLGGARVEAELVRAAMARLKVTVHPGYGSTEGPGAFPRRYDPVEVLTKTYGKGMCPYDVYKIVDGEGREVPAGREGEILFRGPCMITGYYKSEEENRDLFTRDGFLHTGDLGKLDTHGNIVITGRKKDIIRRGAESISAAEVEDAIVAHPKVFRAAVVGMPDPRLGERVCAYVQVLPKEKLDFQQLIAYLKTQGLSAPSLPERLELVEELPFTATDKVDKRRLREDIREKLAKESST